MLVLKASANWSSENAASLAMRCRWILGLIEGVRMVVASQGQGSCEGARQRIRVASLKRTMASAARRGVG
jgi:hypothetical protein